MITSSSDSAFDEFSVRVWNASMIAIAGYGANAVQVGCSHFLVLLFHGAECFACSFDVVWREWSTVSAEGEECCACIRWAINDVLLTRLTDVGEDQVIESSSNKWMRVRDLLRPEIKNLTRPWGDVANNAEVIHEGVEVPTS